MLRRLGNRRIDAAFAAVLGSVLLLAGAAVGRAAEQPTGEQILDALKAKRLTRCPQASAASGCGGAQLGQPAADKPSVDLEIHFAYATAVPRPAARPTLAALGRPEMKGIVSQLRAGSLRRPPRRWPRAAPTPTFQARGPRWSSGPSVLSWR